VEVELKAPSAGDVKTGVPGEVVSLRTEKTSLSAAELFKRSYTRTETKLVALSLKAGKSSVQFAV